MTTTPTEPQASQSGGPAGNASRRSWVWGAMSWTTLITFVVIFAVDQAHKWWMLLVFNLEERGRVAITSFMDVIFVLNTGISYSLLDGDSQSWQYTLAAFAVLVSAAMWIWAAREATGWLFAAAIGLIIGGALGNALDRVLVGGVIDYVSLHAYGYRWYIFNIADVAIVAGVIGLLYDSLWLSRNSATNTP
ncbi:MAG: signal peptidase II [Pseudomonadota bacterium]